MAGRLAIVIAVAAVAMLAFGVSAASARSPYGPTTVKLTVAPPPPFVGLEDDHAVTVVGGVRTSLEDARDAIRNKFWIDIHFWGEDTFSDDQLFLPFAPIVMHP